MPLTRGLTAADGVFTSTALLQAADLKAALTVAVNDGLTIQFYETSLTNSGSAVGLTNGLFANPVTDPAISDMQQDILELRGLDTNSQVGTAYTLALTDADKGEVFMNNAAPNVLTIPTNAAVAFAIDTVILITQEGAGVTSVTADTGVTLNGVVAGSGDLSQYSGVAIKKRGSDTWIATPLSVS